MTTPTATCPHCGRSISHYAGYASHIRCCIQNPTIDALLRQCLRNETTGYMKSTGQYDATRLPGAPASDTLAVQLAPGGWRKLAAHFGLELTPTGRPRKDGSLPVPSGRGFVDVVITGPIPRRIEEGEAYTRQGILVCETPTVAQWIGVLRNGVAVKVTEQFWRVR